LATAYHEAGHALAHARLKFPFWSVSIIPRFLPRPMRGYVHMPDFADHYAQSERRIIEAAVTMLAGPLSEQRATGRADVGMFYDYESTAHLLADRLDGHVSLRQIERITHALLEEEWPQVERIAHALLDRQRLSAGDVFALLD
jgi:ATP-dependent Zn protease